MARILIATFGLAAHNTRLMPWRTVLEVATGLRARGHNVRVLSISDKTNPPPFVDGDSVVTLPRRRGQKMRRSLNAWLGSENFDVVFLPVSCSANSLMRKLLKGIGDVRIGYLPGSIFDFKQLTRAIGRMPFCAILPYLAQSMFPGLLLAHALEALQLQGLITNSNYSTRRLARLTDIPVFTIPPGRDTVDDLLAPADGSTVLQAQPPYLLFMGPPLPIRGVFVLLDAYLQIADHPDVPPLLCLFRADAHLDVSTLSTKIEKRWHHEKIRFVWKSLTPQDLQTHVQMAAAVIMPFLIVPSEIPLAIYEAAGMAKTVITTGPNGTAEFVSKFGLVVRPGDADALAETMLELVRRIDPGQISDNAQARAAFAALDDWQGVADRWGATAGLMNHGGNSHRSNDGTATFTRAQCHTK